MTDKNGIARHDVHGPLQARGRSPDRSGSYRNTSVYATYLQFNINCTSVYQSDAESALTLFNRY